MRFYTTVKLGPNRELTPAGFTLFKNVSIARIGEMVYGPEETGMEPGPDGLVHLNVTEDELFRPETLASFNGSTFVIDHPDSDVTPDNWKYLSHGFFVEVRRGSGDQKDEMVGDLLVTTREGLADIDSSSREISAGYDADYFQTGEGRGDKRNIIGNHVARVDAGRCGPRCAIKDHKHKPGECHMKNKKSFLDRIMDAVRTKDEDSAKKIIEEMNAEDAAPATHIHVHTADKAKDEEEDDPNEKRFKKIEDALAKIADGKRGRDDESEEEKKAREKKEKETKDAEAEEERKKKAEDESMEAELEDEAPEGMKDRARKAKDSAYLVDSFENVKMIAEIISPGIRIPTFDKASDPKKSFKDCICGLRRKALQLGSNDPATAGMIEQVRGRVTDSAEFITMPCGQVRTIFNAVGSLKKAHNNGELVRDGKAGSRAQDEEMTPIKKFKAASDKRWGIGK